MKKTILTIITIITLLATIGTLPTYAALPDPGETVEPMWKNVIATSSYFSFSSGYGSAEMSVTARPGTSSTTISIRVYKQVGLNWILIDESSETFTSLAPLHYVLFNAVRNGSYKAEFSITTDRLGIIETIAETRYATYDDSYR